MSVSSHVPQHHASHQRKCELHHMEAMVWTVKKGMRFDMYECVYFARLKNTIWFCKLVQRIKYKCVSKR